MIFANFKNILFHIIQFAWKFQYCLSTWLPINRVGWFLDWWQQRSFLEYHLRIKMALPSQHFIILQKTKKTLKGSWCLSTTTGSYKNKINHISYFLISYSWKRWDIVSWFDYSALLVRLSKIYKVFIVRH